MDLARFKWLSLLTQKAPATHSKPCKHLMVFNEARADLHSHQKERVDGDDRIVLRALIPGKPPKYGKLVVTPEAIFFCHRSLMSDTFIEVVRERLDAVQINKSRRLITFSFILAGYKLNVCCKSIDLKGIDTFNITALRLKA